MCSAALTTKGDLVSSPAVAVSARGWKAALKSGDPQRLVELAKLRAESGDREGAFVLGLLEDLGAGAVINHEEASRWIELSAKAQYKPAALYLSWRYGGGWDANSINTMLANQWAQAGAGKLNLPRGLDQWIEFKNGKAKPNFPRAFAWMTKGAEVGNLIAEGNLASAYLSGPWVKPDYVQHVHWLETAAKSNDLDALEMLSRYYMIGIFVKADPAKALEYLVRAAEAGSVTAQTLLANRYEEGNGVERNPTEALKWYRKASVTNPQAFDSLLRLLRFGAEGLAPNRDEAMAVAEAGVLKNNLNAIVTLADLLEGTDPASNARAGELYKTAAAKNNARAAAMLGWMEEKGLLGPADPKQAAEWFLKAGNGGETWALRELGLLYENGNGVPADPVKAFDFIEKAAQAGDREAQNHLGWMLRQGVGVDKDNEEAIVWFKLAAEKGEPIALANLAYQYLNGLGAARDLHTAFDYICKASLASGDDWVSYTFRQVASALWKGDPKVYNDSLLKFAEDPLFARSPGDLPELILDSLAPTPNPVEQKRSADYATKLASWNRPQSAATLAWHCYTGMYMPYDLAKARQYIAQIPEEPKRNYLRSMIESIAADSAEERAQACALVQQLADAGNNNAQTLLARRYAVGEGVDVDVDKALNYYNLAAVGRGEPIVTTREELFSKYHIKERPVVSEMAVGVALAQTLSDSRDANPRPFYQLKPYYPMDLWMAGMTGQVMLQFDIDTDGHVSKVVSLKWTHPLFRIAAENGIKGWRFVPGKKGGKFMNTRVIMPLNFALNNQPDELSAESGKFPALSHL